MLKDKRSEIIQYIKNHKSFLDRNREALEIYEGDLKKYVDHILSSSLSATYYKAIKDRVLPINVLTRFIDKVSTTYAKPPKRTSENANIQNFVDFYAREMDLNQSGMIADQYSNLFKGFAWKPYVDERGRPAIKELSFDKFLVMSTSSVSPETETIFIEFMGKQGDSDDSYLFHVYTDTEFDSFFLNGATNEPDLKDNGGVNLYGVIPYVYGKRQKNKLIPTIDSDILAITKTIPCMISDAAGAQMFQCFSVIYGVDVGSENLSLSPNAFWSFKSDKESNNRPEIGTIKPEADTEKVIQFVTNIFVLWLETKGIRVGSIGSINSGNVASGIAKIIDEMDVYEIKKKSMQWFKKDEEELWNYKMPKIHNQWIKSGMIDASKVPAMVTENVDIKVEFEFPEPMIPRSEELDNTQKELNMGTIKLRMAAKRLHPEYTEEELNEIEKGDLNGMDANQDFNSQNDQPDEASANS